MKDNLARISDDQIEDQEFKTPEEDIIKIVDLKLVSNNPTEACSCRCVSHCSCDCDRVTLAF